MASTPGVEQRSIDYVPRSERHGTPSSQFTLWFGANMQITAVVDGALAVVFGAHALWAIVGATGTGKTGLSLDLAEALAEFALAAHAAAAAADPAARAALRRRPWPGNLRELGNALGVAAADLGGDAGL